MIELTIVIPVYNEEKSLPALCEALSSTITTLKAEVEQGDVDNKSQTVEVLFVNDGSTDNSQGILWSLVKTVPEFRCIALSRNFGHQPAVLAGLRFARGRWVAVIDADLQDPPELILEMLRTAKRGFDVVYAVRRTRQTTWYKNFCYKMYYRLNSLIAEQPIQRDAGDFSLVSRRVVDIIKQLPEKESYVRGLRAWVGFKQIALPYDRKDREHGESKYSLKSLIRLAFRGILSTTTKPLLVSGMLTGVSAMIVLGIILYALVPKLFMAENPIPKGWASLMMAVGTLSGFQLLSLWMLSLYIAKVYREVIGRPTFIVESDSLTLEHSAKTFGTSDDEKANDARDDSSLAL